MKETYKNQLWREAHYNKWKNLPEAVRKEMDAKFANFSEDDKLGHTSAQGVWEEHRGNALQHLLMSDASGLRYESQDNARRLFGVYALGKEAEFSDQSLTDEEKQEVRTWIYGALLTGESPVELSEYRKCAETAIPYKEKFNAQAKECIEKKVDQEFESHCKGPLDELEKCVKSNEKTQKAVEGLKSGLSSVKKELQESIVGLVIEKISDKDDDIKEGLIRAISANKTMREFFHYVAVSIGMEDFAEKIAPGRTEFLNSIKQAREGLANTEVKVSSEQPTHAQQVQECRPGKGCLGQRVFP